MTPPIAIMRAACRLADCTFEEYCGRIGTRGWSRATSKARMYVAAYLRHAVAKQNHTMRDLANIVGYGGHGSMYATMANFDTLPIDEQLTILSEMYLQIHDPNRD